MGLFSKLFPFTLSLCLLAIAAALPTSAAPPSAWQNEPSWAQENPASNRRSSLREEPRHAFVPFAPGTNNVSLDVGQVFLMGDLGTNYSDSIGAQLHYTYGVSDLFAFDASLGYSDHSDGKFSMTTLLGGLRTNLAWFDRVVPYAVFGLGFYRPSYQTVYTSALSGNSTSSSVSPVLFGVHLGPGVDLALTRQLFFGASLTFHDVFGSLKQTPAGPISVGGTFTSFLVRAGVTF